ncbi:galactokinase [Nocardioides sp. BP30]|uniref:galactokinase n=1 Tax=Nocardioides sp. BP30 TaxID=3036374 RepID=UPI002468E044|nr:galactokinase [Nocardioides sp. BP30]WGL52347.1 galactokinase [Nocardioides sp. BP30]
MESPTSAATNLGEEAAAGFRERFGHEPDGVWSAPGRVNLIGEHTDYNEGFVLPIAIDQRTWVAVGRRHDRLVRVASTSSSTSGDTVVEHGLDDIAHGSVDGWSAYPLGTAWGLLQAAGDTELGSVGGFDAYFTSDVPLGAGLSSSAAIECALATALVDLWRLPLDSDRVLRATVQAENIIVGAPTGILDQSASLFSRAGHALFIDCRDSSRESIPFPLTEAGLRLVVIDTRVKHAHADGGYGDRRAACEEAARVLGVAALRDVSPEALEEGRERLDEVIYRRARHIVTEDARVQQTVALLRSQGPRSIGELLLASHASMRDDFEISVPELDTAVETSMAAGAIGARMTGGGFGGSAIALVDAERVEELTEAIGVAFAKAGFEEPVTFVVTPAGGARRESR